MDSPSPSNVSIEGTQALLAMAMNSQTLSSDSTSPEYYPWTYQNACFPGFQGELTASQLQYPGPIFAHAVSQGGVPRKQSERSLMKNREAAREYRRRKKIYIQDLEKRAEKLETENMALREELNTWKMGRQKSQ
ncbi:CREB homolog crh-1-like isoform X2 [Stigmatopora nigra]